MHTVSARSLLMTVFVTLASPTLAATVYVNLAAPGPTYDGTSWTTAFTGVQEAVNAAQPGDEVWVAKGIYTVLATQNGGTVLVLNAPVAVFGGFSGTETQREQRDPALNVTVLDGNNVEARVVKILAGATSPASVDGFTVRNGKRGGILIEGGAPVIQRNLIDGNSCVLLTYISHMPVYSGDGGGIAVLSGYPLIQDNKLLRNKAGGAGSVIALLGGATSLFRNHILRNDNFETPAAFITVKNADAEIRDNVIAFNTGFYSIGGIEYPQRALDLIGTSVSVVNNTIIGNNGGISVSGSAAKVSNNIIAFNKSGVGIGAGAQFRSNCVWMNTAGNYEGTDQTGLNGNISADPKLNDPYGYDFGIRRDSPCFDAGYNAEIQPGETDITGRTRIYGAHVDMGAVESTGAAILPLVYVRPDGNDANDGSTWNLAKKSIQAGIDVVAQGGQVWVAEGTYPESVRLKFGALLYGGFAGTETIKEQRDWRTHISKIVSPGRQAVSAGIPALGGEIYGTPHLPHTFDGFDVWSEQQSTDSAFFLGVPVVVSFNVFHGSVRLADCEGLFVGNVIRDSQDVGLSVGGVGSSNIIRNILLSNGNPQAHPWISNGGGIDAHDFTLIKGNLIGGNRGRVGGGVNVSGFGVDLVNNTIVGNTATEGGGGVYYSNNGNGTVVNNVVAFNTSGIYASGDVTFRHNDVFGNTAYDYSGVPDQTGTNGNIRQDPLFVSATDFRPGPGSPLIDAGDNSALDPGDVDLDGKLRPAGVHIDIGAYEAGLPLSMADVALCLRIAGGILGVGSGEMDKLNVSGSQVPDPRIEVLDAVKLVRILAGLDRYTHD